MQGSVTISSRPLVQSLGLMCITVVAGMTVRFVPLGLPACIVKYGGSMLWALMIYWVATAVLGARPIIAVALLSGVVCTGVEFLKLYHAPTLDVFRLTVPGMLLLGRFFSAWDIVAYWVAIAFGAFADIGIRPAERQSSWTG